MASLYQDIFKDLLEKIESGHYPPGSLIPKEIDLIDEYKVSRITITRAIKELQQIGMVFRIKGKGTYVTVLKPSAVSERKQGEKQYSKLVSVVFPRGKENSAHKILLGIEGECSRAGYLVAIHNSNDSPKHEREIIQSIVSQDHAGIILFPCSDNSANLSIYSHLVINNVPSVLIDRKSQYLSMPSVACDNRKGMHMLADYLFGKGYRTIAFVCHSTVSISSEQERFQGYCDGLIGAGKEIDPELIFQLTQHPEDYAESGFPSPEIETPLVEEVTERILASGKRVDAIMAVNDLLALSFMKAAIRRGLSIPSDIAITGFDDLDLSGYAEVPLTTYHQPFEQIGQKAAAILLEQLDLGAESREDRAADHRISGELVVRSSA